MDNEIWKSVVGYEGLYEVSSLGRVKSLSRTTTKGKLLSFYIDKSRRHKVYGRPTLRLSKNGKTKLHHVCRLVALAHIPNPENKPEVNHIDCNPENNKAENLEWTTRKENHQHSVVRRRMASGEAHGMSKLTKDQVREIRQKKESPRELAQKMNVSRGTIYRIQNNRSWVQTD